jgi:hypothetical protein
VDPKEFWRAALFLQGPIVLFLCVASFQLSGWFGRAPFRLCGIGWGLNLLYLIANHSALEHLVSPESSLHQVLGSQPVEALFDLSTIVLLACQSLIYLPLSCLAMDAISPLLTLAFVAVFAWTARLKVQRRLSAPAP